MRPLSLCLFVLCGCVFLLAGCAPPKLPPEAVRKLASAAADLESEDEMARQCGRALDVVRLNGLQRTNFEKEVHKYCSKDGQPTSLGLEKASELRERIDKFLARYGSRRT